MTQPSSSATNPSPSPSRVSCRGECRNTGPSACKRYWYSFWDGCCLCGWCARKFKFCHKCRKCCVGRCCRKIRRKCIDLLRCRCCNCCWSFTPEDYDKAFMDKPPRKLKTPMHQPTITRKVENVEYVRRKKRRANTSNVQNENETEVYFCTIKLDSLRSNSNFQQSLATLLSQLPATLNAGHNKGLKNQDTLNQSKSCDYGLQKQNNDTLNVQKNSLVSRTVCDLERQFNLQSNQSLELKSHLLTKSTSQLSSVQSIFSLKWRKQFKKYANECRSFNVFLSNLSNKFKKQSQKIEKSNKKNLLFLHKPKIFSNMSTADSVSTSNNMKFVKPLTIKDDR